MPPNSDCHNIYAADGANLLAHVGGERPAPGLCSQLQSNTVSVIDQATDKVIQTIPVGAQPQHVGPSYDLKTLWVNNDQGNSLTPIDPETGVVGAPVPVDDPYNLYFTPDGTRAVVMAEALKKMDFRDAHTMALLHSMPVPCYGLNHMDFSPDGRTAVAACEFDGQLLLIDMTNGQEKVLQTIQGRRHAPGRQAVARRGGLLRGRHADERRPRHRRHHLQGARRSSKTGKGAHGLYPSRDATKLYVSNRDEGSVSVIDFATRSVVAKWVFDGGKGSPDMGGVSADGKVLWLTGRYDNEMYAISTDNRKLIVPPIKVGQEPHGACVWPQPGRYSMGHTGVMR